MGRPTRAESKKRHEALLDNALDIFLERGFEQTTMMDIAAAANVSKRTIYAKYEDKTAFFNATVLRAIEHYVIPLETLQAIETDDLEETLTKLARLRVSNVATPNGIKLLRILTLQTYRSPELSEAFFEQGRKPTIDFLSDLLSRHTARGDIYITNPRRAAVAFLNLVVGGPSRIITSGKTLDEAEVTESIQFSVQLFLNGVRHQ